MKKKAKGRSALTPPPPGAIVATAEEAAAMFRVSRAKFLAMVKDGRAPQGSKMGGNRRWNVEQLKAWEASGYKPPNPSPVGT
ncbi:MAG: hypothetical protein DPW14_17525 [Planctomycetes bacterium]|nr:hypothetical protein [Planctomycetota bacterium]